MSLDYETLNLDAIIGKSKSCECDGCIKLTAMKEELLSQIISGKVKKIRVHNHLYFLTRSLDINSPQMENK